MSLFIFRKALWGRCERSDLTGFNIKEAKYLGAKYGRFKCKKIKQDASSSLSYSFTA